MWVHSGSREHPGTAGIWVVAALGAPDASGRGLAPSWPHRGWRPPPLTSCACRRPPGPCSHVAAGATSEAEADLAVPLPTAPRWPRVPPRWSSRWSRGLRLLAGPARPPACHAPSSHGPEPGFSPLCSPEFGIGHEPPRKSSRHPEFSRAAPTVALVTVHGHRVLRLHPPTPGTQTGL